MQKAIAIVGPTASGKSALGVYLAKKLGGEIISADSRQIYRGMNIISGTPSFREMAGVPHHLLSAIRAGRTYSAGTFKKEGEKLMSRIVAKKHIPIIVGGAGFYADALLGTMPLPEVTPDKKLRARLQKKTASQLYAQLCRVDPRRAKEIDPRNYVRLIRAIEIVRALGKVPKLKPRARYNILWIGLSLSSATLKKSIRIRLFARISRGMIAEARRLRKELGNKRFLSLGGEFQLLARYLDEKISKQELTVALERWELHYAKRQMRWLRRNSNIHWISKKTDAIRLSRVFLQR